MGREVKRVALDFDWPENLPWKGYMSPYKGQECVCKGTGMNPETAALGEAFYALNERHGHGRWCNSITQDEVQALVDADRLYDFTSHFVPGKGWQPNDPPTMPSAEQVNEWNQRGFGHDAINRWILIETRAKRLGIYGKCKWCDGEGSLWPSDEYRKLSDEWERIDPPVGEGWQVWETVSEGSPITPVFATREALVDHLVEGGDGWDRKRGEAGWSRDNAESFVGDGWAPSLITGNGVILQPRDGSLRGESQ